MVSKKFAAAACAGLCLSSFGFAEDPVRNRGVQIRAPGVQVQVGVPGNEAGAVPGIATPAQNDGRILQWVKIDCDALHECAKAAASKAASEDVKAFAAKVVADHEKWAPLFKSKTAVSAYTPAGTGRAQDATAKAEDAPADQARRTAALIKDDGAMRDGRLAYAPTDFVEVKRKVCARMKAVGEAEMKNLSGADFDRAFLFAAKMGHEAALASIAEVRSGASSALAETLDQAKEGLTAHLTSAEALCKAQAASR